MSTNAVFFGVRLMIRLGLAKKQFCFLDMSAKKTKKSERPLFDSIRKPTAPPGRKMGEDKPAEKARPSGRGAKHKPKTETDD